DRLLLRQAGLSRGARRARPHLAAADGPPLPGDEHDLRVGPARLARQDRAGGDRRHPTGEIAMRGLKGRTAVVTGGAAGIGAAIVQRLRDEGTRVEIFDLNASPALDITDYAAVQSA